MNPLKRRLLQILRSTVSPRSVHRLKLNTVFRLTFILIIGGAGLTARANLQQEQDADKQGNDVTVSFAERLQIEAEQGGVVLQVALGCRYRDGRGVPQDDRLAVEWYRKAAEQRDADAQIGPLGRMYEASECRGVPRRRMTSWPCSGTVKRLNRGMPEPS